MDSADKLAVAETVYRYATGVDRRDWALYRSLFTDTVTIDFSGYSPDQPPRVMSADDWVAGLVPLFTGLAATQHSMTNPLATVDGDAATITMYMRAHHVYDPDDPASWYTVGGYYDDTLVRVDSRWLLTSVRLTVTWRAGDPAIMERARAAGNRLLGS
jgi:SnoaL-like protein